MPETYDLGKHLFIHTARLKPGSSRFHRAPTHELDFPYRRSNSLVVRLRGSHGLVIGWWRATDRTDEKALQDALRAGLGPSEEMPTLDVTDDSPFGTPRWRRPLDEDVAEEVLAAARRQVAEHALSPQEEREFLNMLGL